MSNDSEIFTPGPWHARKGDVLNPERPWGIVRELSPSEAGFDDEDPEGQGRTVVIAELCSAETEAIEEADARLLASAPQMRASLLKALAYLTPEQAEDCEIIAALGRVEPAPPKPTRVVVIGCTPYVVSTTEKGQELMRQHNLTSGWVHECVVDAGLKKPERDH